MGAAGDCRIAPAALPGFGRLMVPAALGPWFDVACTMYFHLI
ncbi:hypothetical protein JOF40_000526 [Aeromicrobium fastidiosum]|nr:hypothetical protein [Aeromicrobium fastidiosum]